MPFDIDGTGGTAAFFRLKLVVMARRAVRILQRIYHYLLPYRRLHQI